nr:reverse transcriptase domain-containing protein [Tanacetum cinerariifolium]
MALHTRIAAHLGQTRFDLTFVSTSWRHSWDPTLGITLRKMSAMANTTPIVTTVTKPATNPGREKTPRDADATPRVNILARTSCQSLWTRFIMTCKKKSMLAKLTRQAQPSPDRTGQAPGIVFTVKAALAGETLLMEIVLRVETAPAASGNHMITPTPPTGRGPTTDIAIATETAPAMGPKGSRKKFPSDSTGETLGNAYMVSHVQFYPNRGRKSMQKKYAKDPVEIHNIKQKDGETIEDFMERFKVKTGSMKGAPECMRISEFMHGVNNSELTKRRNEHVPNTMKEMMITTTAFIRGEAAAAGKKKGDVDHSTRAWMHFMIVRSLSPYNGIIRRPGIKEIQSVPSTAHGMLKFPTDGGIVTIRSTILIPAECATVITLSREIPKEAGVRHENFKVALNPNFPDQEVAIGGTLFAKGRTELCLLLRQVFANVVSAGIAKGMSEGLAHGIEHGKAGRDLELEGLKDAPMEVITTSLHLGSDSGKDAPKWIHDLLTSTSQLKIPIYPKVRNPRNPWAVKEEMLPEEAIAANVSCAEKKKRCRVVCRTHGVGFAHHARSEGVPEGIAILLADTATQTETSKDDASLRLLRSKSLLSMHNLDWP